MPTRNEFQDADFAAKVTLAQQWLVGVVDDALSFRLGEQNHRSVIDKTYRRAGFDYPARLVVWEQEQIAIAVQSYLDCYVDDDEAIELAYDAAVEYCLVPPDCIPDYVL